MAESAAGLEWTGVGITLGAIAGVFVLAKLVKKFKDRITFPFATILDYPIFSALFSIGAIAPDLAVASGFISDLFLMQFRYSAISLSAIVAVLMNWLVLKWGALSDFIGGEAPGFSPATTTSPIGVFSSLFGKKVDVLPEKEVVVGMLGGASEGPVQRGLNVCDLQGFSYFHSKAPLAMIALITVMGIYGIDAVRAKPADWHNLLIYGAVILAFHIMSIQKFGCGYSTRGYVYAILAGSFAAGLAYLILYLIEDTTGPLLPFSSPISATPAPAAAMPQCDAVGGTDDTTVCDMYINGKRVTASNITA